MKPIELTAAQKTLLLAADYIEEHGWCQHTNKAPWGVCVAYALAHCGGQAAVYAQMELHRRVGTDVVYWNDRPGRTKEEVLAALRSVE